VPLYIASESVTVTFNGDDLSMEFIECFTDAELKGDNITVNNSQGLVKFEVQKYVYSGNSQEFDELVQAPEDIPVYLTGNYAKLSKPGYYLVVAGPGAQNNTPVTLSALPTASSVVVNGKAISFEAYNIDGNNFFKLRDLAMAVNGTAKKFEVTWDDAKNAISLVSGQAYTSVGGELAVSEKQTTKGAAPTASKILVNGQDVQLTAYNIEGNNYFKLRDIAKVMDTGTTWDGATSTIGYRHRSCL
jgi:hypothetical protein